jgi:hypothetical protein
MWLLRTETAHVDKPRRSKEGFDKMSHRVTVVWDKPHCSAYSLGDLQNCQLELHIRDLYKLTQNDKNIERNDASHQRCHEKQKVGVVVVSDAIPYPWAVTRDKAGRISWIALLSDIRHPTYWSNLPVQRLHNRQCFARKGFLA